MQFLSFFNLIALCAILFGHLAAADIPADKVAKQKRYIQNDLYGARFQLQLSKETVGEIEKHVIRLIGHASRQHNGQVFDRAHNIMIEDTHAIHMLKEVVEKAMEGLNEVEKGYNALEEELFGKVGHPDPAWNPPYAGMARQKYEGAKARVKSGLHDLMVRRIEAEVKVSRYKDQLAKDGVIDKEAAKRW